MRVHVRRKGGFITRVLLPSGDKWEVCLICHFAMLLLNGRMHVIALFTILPCYCLTAVCFINELIYDDVDFRYVDFKIVFLYFDILFSLWILYYFIDIRKTTNFYPNYHGRLIWELISQSQWSHFLRGSVVFIFLRINYVG